MGSIRFHDRVSSASSMFEPKMIHYSWVYFFAILFVKFQNIFSFEISVPNFVSDIHTSEYNYENFVQHVSILANMYKAAAKQHYTAMKDSEPETRMNTVELIQHWGYPAEAHDVITKDGYILEIHRIPSNDVGDKIPVLLQHGLLSSSADYVINLKNQSLGMMLADANFDVWIGNIRGNTYGRRHQKLKPCDTKFWEFSWDEMAAYDIPAVIDYILTITGHQQLHYVGHSMGTTMAFAMLATKPEYNDKVRQMFALAPIVHFDNAKQQILRYLAAFYKEIKFLLKVLDFKEFLPNNNIMKYLAETLCSSAENEICADFIFQLIGKDSAELNRTRLPVYLTHTPAGTSFQTLAHYAQLINSKKWQHYDWGYLTNLIKYGSIRPPLYNVTNIKTRVALFYGQNDPLADPKDVYLLSLELQNLTDLIKTGDDNWNHLDFLWGINTGPLLNIQLINLMNKLENEQKRV